MSTVESYSPDLFLQQFQELFSSIDETQTQGKNNRQEPGNLSRSIDTDSASSSDSSLVPLQAPKSNVDLMLALQSIQIALDNEGIKTGKEDALVLSQKREQHHKEVMEAIQKSIDAMAKASRSGKIGKIFGWIAATAALVAGAVLIATGGGAVAGALLMGLAIDQMVGMATGNSLMGKATEALADGLKNLGMGEPANMIVAAVIVTILVTVVTCGAGAAASGSRAVKAGSDITNASTKTANVASTAGKASMYSRVSSSVSSASQKVSANAAEFTSRFISEQTANLLKNMGLFVSSSAQVGGASANIDAAIHTKESGDARAEEAMIRKVIAQNSALLEQTIEHIKSLTENSESTFSQMMEYINQEQQTNKKIIREMA